MGILSEAVRLILNGVSPTSKKFCFFAIQAGPINMGFSKNEKK